MNAGLPRSTDLKGLVLDVQTILDDSRLGQKLMIAAGACVPSSPGDWSRRAKVRDGLALSSTRPRRWVKVSAD